MFAIRSTTNRPVMIAHIALALAVTLILGIIFSTLAE